MSAKVIELFPNGAPPSAVSAERMSAAARVKDSLYRWLRMEQFIEHDREAAKQYGARTLTVDGQPTAPRRTLR
jgi:hypothetical protein